MKKHTILELNSRINISRQAHEFINTHHYQNTFQDINEFGRYLQIRYDEQPKDDNNLDTQSEFPRNVTYIQQEAPQTLPNATPTPQLPDTPTIIPETQQQDEPQVEQQQTKQIRKEILINSKVQQTQHLPKQNI